MKRFAILWMICFLLAGTGSALAASGPKIEAEEDVVGRVRVLCDIADVTVELAGFTFQTRAGKAVVIGNVPVGAHEVVAAKKGYQTWRSKVTITPDVTVLVNIKMWAETGDQNAPTKDKGPEDKVVEAKEEMAKEMEQSRGGEEAEEDSAQAQDAEAAASGKQVMGEGESIEELLAGAEEDKKALRLAVPADNNALDKYRLVLAANPGNVEALKGLDRIVDSYLVLADRSLARGEKRRAETYLQKAAKVKPDDKRVLALWKKMGLNPAELKTKRPKKVKKVVQGGLPKIWTNPLGMKFVLCPAGIYFMGSRDGIGYADERPQHRVTLTRPFYISIYEISQLIFQRVTGENPSRFRETAQDFQSKLQRPVERVDWNQANRFCDMLSALEGDFYRLPTEAEWEYACRAGRGRVGPVGVKGSQTQPIGQSKPNPWGIYDMQGNVYEWCSDYYSPTAYADGENVDPQGPEKGRDRVARGGSYMSDHTDDGSTGSNQRGHFPPHFRKEFIGFRVVRVPPQQ